MNLAFEKINWQYQRRGEISCRSVDNRVNHINLDESVGNDAPNFDESLSNSDVVRCYQELMTIKDGFNLARHKLKTSVPIDYPPIKNDSYVGLCYTFTDKFADIQQTALPHLFHSQMNITNGYDYEKSTHHLLNHETYYVSLRFSKTFLNNIHQQQALPKWLMSLVDGKSGQLDKIAVDDKFRQIAWRLLQYPQLQNLLLSHELAMQADALHWLSGLLELETVKNTYKNSEKTIISHENIQNLSSFLSVDTVNKACQIIESNLRSPLTTHQLALQVGTNECYLKQAFRKHAGMTIHQYLTDYRLKKSCQLLQKNPSMSIINIAEICGYKASHFSQVFKKHFLMSPKEYRLKSLVI